MSYINYLKNLINRKITLKHWWYIRYIILIVLNMYLWLIPCNLINVIVINSLIILLVICVNVYATTMGIMYSEHRRTFGIPVNADEYLKEVLENNKPKKNNLN